MSDDALSGPSMLADLGKIPRKEIPVLWTNHFPLPEGDVALQYPSRLSPESAEDLLAWWDLMRKRFQRAAQSGLP